MSSFAIKYDGKDYIYDIRFKKDERLIVIELPNEFVFYLFKFGDHDYSLRCFFYRTKWIGYFMSIKSKNELLNVIQSELDNFSRFKL